ncbi:MAG: DUF6551 family protein [Gammaproteobacteria bacterium]
MIPFPTSSAFVAPYWRFQMAEHIAQLEPKWEQKDVEIGKIRVPPHAQRRFNPARCDYVLAHLDLDAFGLPVVNLREGHYYVIDGQHRIKALVKWLGQGWETQKIACRVFDGLSEAEESKMFDRLNDSLQVNAFDKFKVRVSAGAAFYPQEAAVNKVVTNSRLVISQDSVPGAISAVGTLMRVYKRANGETLGRALRIARDAYGDAGLEAPVIDGLGHLCQRYNGALKEDEAVDRLSVAHGGVKGLLNKASKIHEQMGQPYAECVAAAAVDIINNGRKGKQKLLNWWKAAEA